MTMTLNLHNVSSMKSEGRHDTTWLKITGDYGEEVTLFVDGRLADMLEETFNEYHDWLSGQEGPSWTDSMISKFEAKARDDEARRLK